MTDQVRANWLAERRTCLTASDVASVLGVEGAYGTEFSVWAEKVGEAEPDEATADYILFGRDVEGAISDGYARKYGRPVRDLGAYVIQRHPDIPWLGATLDRMTAGSETHPAPAAGEGPAEFKAVGFSKVREWSEEPPLKFQVQAQIQMACTGKEWASLCALFGGVKLGEPVDVLRHDTFLRNAYPRLEEFWLKVQRREAPEADGSIATSEAIRSLWGIEDGETIRLDDPLDVLQADLLEEARAEVRAAEARVKLIDNQLRARMGSASFGRLSDGTLLTLQTTSRAGYTVAPTTYRALRRKRERMRRRG